jgi:hypothetical protein
MPVIRRRANARHTSIRSGREAGAADRYEPLLRQVRHARNPNDVPLNDVVTTILELVDP